MSALKKLVSALLVLTLAVSGGLLAWHGLHRKIGRASCRERV